MLHLTEISLRRAAAVEATMVVDPLVAADLDYCLKTWMRERPSLACRPWRATTLRDGVRIAGWRREGPGDGGDGAYVGSRVISFEPGQKLTFSTRFIALRRNPRTRRDAADGYQNPVAAYETWLKERLIDISSAAATDSVTIESHAQRLVLRKTNRDRLRTRVQQEIIPVVNAIVEMTVRDATKLEEWLLIGVGPQKGFGYGAFLPAPDTREAP